LQVRHAALSLARITGTPRGPRHPTSHLAALRPADQKIDGAKQRGLINQRRPDRLGLPRAGVAVSLFA